MVSAAFLDPCLGRKELISADNSKVTFHPGEKSGEKLKGGELEVGLRGRRRSNACLSSLQFTQPALLHTLIT